ncbi:hypothetical protein ONR57_11780 [Hoyosella sp. YIM 151337]|uniref:hypothetical protein n=1 Tax=Hoyosella sp. YIM 151337 TaxID=2992742 RepID=UPI0022355A5C|nr:hypothetical protein [Hoyosella sp. YIM 151337]MCW4353979.1 hypothetical protein [Hoyosella sp. YIM 151337]
MRTLIIISAGILLALVALAMGKRSRLGSRGAAIAFIALWTVAMIANLGLGLSHGYSLAEELPILLVNILPAGLVAVGGAYLASRRSSPVHPGQAPQ